MFKKLAALFRKHTSTHSTLHLAQRQVLAVRGARRLPTLGQWRQLPRYLSPGEKRIFSAAVIGIVLAVAVLGYRFVASHQTTVPAVGGEYTEGLIGTPQFLNPLYAVASDTDTDLTRLIFSGLMRWDPNEGLTADLAESYTVSDDQKTYTFVLRSDAVWHDGQPVVAEDVVFTMLAIANPEFHSPLRVSFTGVGVEAVDDRTVVFTLAEPFAPFLSTLTVGILPSHYWENIPPSSAQLAPINLQPVGSGPYAFKKITMDQKGVIKTLLLERNEAFYRGAPYIASLTMKFYADATSLVQALKDKHIEGAGYVPFADATSLGEDRSLRIVNPTLQQVTAVFFNDTHAAALAESKVRQALTLATDRQMLIANALAGQASPITSPILPGMPGYDAAIGATAFDTAAAAALLDAAGYTLTEGETVRKKSDAPLALTLTTADTPELLAVAEVLKAQWAQIGVDVTVHVVSRTALLYDVLKNRSYDMLLTGELYSPFPDPYPFWHSSQVAYPGLNLAQFASRKADDAIERARATINAEERATAFAELATILADEYPAVFLYQPTYTYVIAPHINNVELPTMTIPADRFADITAWYSKTRRVFTPTAEPEDGGVE